jgi:hypothetical protein
LLASVLQTDSRGDRLAVGGIHDADFKLAIDARRGMEHPGTDHNKRPKEKGSQ